MLRRIFNRILILLAIVLVAYAAVFFTIILWPDSPPGRWLARHDPIFRLLQSTGLGPKRVEKPMLSTRPTPPPIVVQGPHMIVVGPGLPVFERPDLSSPVIGEVRRWLRLPALEETDGWFRLQFSFGKGWIHPFIAPPAEPEGEGTVAGTPPAGGGAGEMRVELRFEPDSGRRPDAVYFDHQRPRPLVFGELFNSANLSGPAASPPAVNPERLQLATVLIGGDAGRLQVGEFILRFRDENWARGAEKVLGGLREAYLEVFQQILPETPARQRAFVFLLPSLRDYRKYFPDARVGTDIRTAGNYEPGIIVLHSELGPGGETLRTLVHEAIHHFNYSVARFPAGNSAQWLDEGVANYFSLSRLDKDGRLRVGEIDRGTRASSRAAARLLSGQVFTAMPPYSRIRALQQELRRGGRIDLADLLSEGGREDFYSGNMIHKYSVSWLLVHYMMRGKGGDYRGRFMRYIMEETGGRGSVETFEEVMGVPIKRLEEELRSYVTRF